MQRSFSSCRRLFSIGSNFNIRPNARQNFGFVVKIKRQSFSSSTNKSPYEILNVSRNATDKEIKLAYFKLAKQHHPDMNPGDPKAKAKFQEISAAYDTLSNNRKAYDDFGRTSENAQQSQQQQANYEDAFHSAFRDADVIKEAWESYSAHVKEEIAFAYESAVGGDWEAVWEVTKANKGIILGIVVPSFVILRFPVAVGFVLRIGWTAVGLIFPLLLRSGEVNRLASWLWQRMIAMSKMKRTRRTRSSQTSSRNSKADSSKDDAKPRGSGRFSKRRY